jgi:transcription initiation factor IIE alpha subunit
MCDLLWGKTGHNTLNCCADISNRGRLHAEDLAFLLGMQQKDLRKLCAKLREDRLIAVYGLPVSFCALGTYLAEG